MGQPAITEDLSYGPDSVPGAEEQAVNEVEDIASPASLLFCV